MTYGAVPISLGEMNIFCEEMMFYQDLPIKLQGATEPVVESRVQVPFGALIGKVACDFIGVYGLDRYVDSYVYISCKNLFQQKNSSFNRQGWHTDGFGTDDINYIWSNKNPTIFNFSDFNLSLDDTLSMQQMKEQALPENDFYFQNNRVLRLDQFAVHRVNPVQDEGMRAFCKVTFSKDKYNLKGNSHNSLIDYKWEMRERGKDRNVPQELIGNNM